MPLIDLEKQSILQEITLLQLEKNVTKFNEQVNAILNKLVIQSKLEDKELKREKILRRINNTKQKVKMHFLFLNGKNFH